MAVPHFGKIAEPFHVGISVKRAYWQT